MPQELAELDAEYGAATVQRGQAYAAAGRVNIVHVERTPAQIHVEATVKGTARQPYRVDLWLALDPTGALKGVDNDCTCPVGMDCKHVVATLLSLSASAARADAAPLAEAFPEPSSAALEWLGEIGAEESQAEPVMASKSKILPQCLVYVLRQGLPARLALGKSRQLKTGGLGKPAPYRPQAYDLGSMRSHREFIRDEDVPPLRLFVALQAGTTYYYNEDVELAGETGALLLRQALRTGRLYLDGQMEQPLRPGPLQPLGLRWVRNPAGLQQLDFELPPGFTVLACWPLFYLDAASGLVGELSSTLSEDVLKKLLAAPPLNEADALLVRQQLSRLAQQKAIEVPLPEASEVLAAGKPVARLTLTRGRFRHFAVDSIYDEHAIAVVHFDYPEGVSVTGAEHPAPMMRCKMPDGTWQTLQRDLASEGEVWAQLQDIGFESFARCLPNYRRLDAGDDCLLPGRSDATGWLPLLEGGIEALEQSGIAVTVADDFPYQLAVADDWFVGVEQEAGGEWFSLDLGVMVAGERISLVPPLMRLLREEPKLLTTVRALDDATTFPVALDENRFLPVPAGRLKAWLLPLLEFLDDERPRLGRHHASALAGLADHATQWIGGEELRVLGQRLRDFSGIEQRLPAEGFQAKLRPYQQIGLDWLQFLREYGLAGILADDMGLGKTVQTLAHLHLEKTSGRADRPSLVVATTSLMSNWKNEAAQFTPDLKVLVLHGKDRAALFEEMAQADIILTTYPLLVRDREVLLARDYHLLVMDEAQFIKNPKAQSHQVARQLKARHRLSLTGTPLENHLGELWAQFDFLMPGLLGQAKRFSQVFRTPIEKQGDEDMRQRLAERVRPFLLRRTKEQVLKDLPPRTEIVRWVELEGGQRDLYESLRVVFDKKLRQVLTEQGVGRSQIMILDALLKLRQVCCDPRLVKLASASALAKKGAVSSAKLATLMEMLEELLDEGRRVLLFSQFTSMLELIEAELDSRKLKYVKLTGQTHDRETPIRAFQEGHVPLFLISLKAGGTGLNLTAADTVIHYDPWWNPAVEEQATARAHRIGQDKPVFVYKLMTQGTVEEKILALQGRKRGLADQLMRKNIAPDEGGGHLITADDLDVLFQPLSQV
ncbi:MAG: DEAD/DEAH box helicase [Rugosibacter sp.]|nr:DEAD/DEAH box helicase [Rugosibacter sp.]